MFVSMDFEVNGPITAEEAIRACRAYIGNYETEPEYKVDIHRGKDIIPATVTMTLVRASHFPAPVALEEN